MAQLTPQGYREISRAPSVNTYITVWEQKVCLDAAGLSEPPVFARNDEELVCASLEVKP